MIKDVTSPQTKKVMASAKAAGQMLGSGNFSDGRTVHSASGSGGIGLEFSEGIVFYERVFDGDWGLMASS